MRFPLRASLSLGVLASTAALSLTVLAQRGGGAPQGRGSTPPAPAPAPAPAPTPESAPAPQGRERAPAPGDRGASPSPASEQESTPPAPEPPPGERAVEYFTLADYDGNGWMGFTEAQKSLGLDRGGFAVYDKDKDGRIDFDEFSTRYQNILAKGGAFQPPLKKPEVRKAPRREAPELLATYDQTPDGLLDVRELRHALADYELAEPPAEELFSTLDRDASKALELIELEALADLLSPKPAGETDGAKPKAKSVLELFGRSVPREVREGSVHLPPQIPGPVPVFRRLDLDDDGAIELDDLSALQRPLQLHVRLNAVFATLDTDADGKLSPEELAASMRRR
ncbi:MAG: hypothetical protein IPJ77_01265 [Planctomycetes bacterium]|nr:hypothetical protein [Planctomycetota bacterium]